MTAPLLANVVRLSHSLVVLYIVLVPFLAPWFLLPGHIGMNSLLMMHWLTNNNTCAWTILEAKLRGLPVEEGFIYSIVRPMFESGRFSFGQRDRRSTVAKVIWVCTITLLLASCYRLYNCKQFWRSLSWFHSTIWGGKKERKKNDDES